MSNFKLNLNFDRLKDYFPNITEEQKAKIKLDGGYRINFDMEYADENAYYRTSDALLEILKVYGLEDHLNEIYYIILLLDCEYHDTMYIQEQSYNDDQTTKELAQFLLTHKTAKPNQAFQLVAKSLTNSASIKNTQVANWMCEVIYNAIETKQFPIDLFGENALLHLFGYNFNDGQSISMERLEIAAKLNTKKPSNKNLLFRFCLNLRTYLNDHTHLISPPEVLLANTHANFFFDVFELMGYLDRNKIESEPKDYIHALFRNQIKVNPS